MKKITIINGEYHEEEMDSPSPKVVDNHNIPPYGTSGVLMFGTGGEMSRFDLDEFRRMWYEESGPFPSARLPITGNIVSTPDDTVTSLALAMRSSSLAMAAMVNSYRGGAYPLSELTEGIGSTSSEQRQFAILKSRRRGASWTNAQAIADRMFNQLATGTPDFWDRTEEEHGRGL